MNPENRNQVIVLIVLGIVLVGVVYMYVIRPSMETGGGAAGGGAAASGDGRIAEIAENVETAFIEDDVDIDALLDNIQNVRFVYSERNLARNPMIPLVGQTVMNPTGPDAFGLAETGTLPDEELLFRAEGLDFNGVVWDRETPLAIIDNEMVHVGYTFDVTDIKVKEIHEDKVVVEVPLSTGPELIEHGLEESSVDE